MRFVPSILFLAMMCIGLALPASAQSARQACNSLNRSNIDCVCVSKRMEAYKARAASPVQARIIAEGYKASLGLENGLEDAWVAMDSDEKRLQMTFQFDGVGGIPQNITDYEEGCAMAGAPLTPVPQFSPGPDRETWIERCMRSVGDRRSCDCAIAMDERRTTAAEFKYLYALRYDYKPGEQVSMDENYQYLARKYGVPKEEFLRIARRGEASVRRYEERDFNFCGSLLWADQRPGRSAEDRAGTPLGFENPGEVDSLANIQREQEEALAQSRAMAEEMDDATIQSMMASAAAEKEAFDKQMAAQKAKGAQLAQASSPRATLDKGCAGSGNEPAMCQCMGRIFDNAVRSSGASDGAAMQLALLMAGGGMDDGDAMAMMQSANQNDLMAATQLYGSNVMSIMNCP